MPAMTDTEPERGLPHPGLPPHGLPPHGLPPNGLPAIVWVGFAISAAFLAYFFKDVAWRELARVLGRAKYIYLLPSLALLLCTYPIRAFRWYYLLPRLPGSTFRNRFSATVIGFMASSIFPLRAGEVVRAALFSVRSGIPIGISFASILLERVFDLIVVLMGLGVCLAAFPGAADAGSLALARKAGMILGAIVVLIVLFLALLKASPRLVRVPLRSILTLLPSQVAERIEKIVNSIVEGLTVIGSPWEVMGILALSIGHWSVVVLANWVAAMSFEDLHLSPIGALLMFTFTSLAVALPQAPGFLGVYNVAVEESLKLLGAPVTPAKGFALLWWTMSIVPVTVLGFLVMWLEGMNLAQVSAARHQAKD